MSDPESPDDIVTQRTVSAAEAPPLRSAAASSVFNWGAVSATPEPTAAPASQPQEEQPMATEHKNRTARTRKSRNGTPQLQVCSALLQNDLSREAIAEACSGLGSAQISSALNNAKAHGRIAWIEKDGVYRISKAGKEWVSAAGDTDQAEAKPVRRATAHKTAHRRRKPAQRSEVDTSPNEEAQDTADATFRCAVMSDGCFFVSKEGLILELTKEGHMQMLRYLERMAEPFEA